MRKTGVSVSLAGALFATACGGSSQSPTAVRTATVSTSSSPAAAPTPTPSPTPQSSGSLPQGLSCGSPTPPPLYRLALKVHAKDGSRTILDSKPLVLNVNGYCDKAGFGDWKFCETRPEGHPERVACDYLVVGRSEATGRWGPTWYFGDDQLCGSDPETCANHPTEQFLAVAKKPGTYVACIGGGMPVADGSSRCGEIEVE